MNVFLLSRSKMTLTCFSQICIKWLIRLFKLLHTFWNPSFMSFLIYFLSMSGNSIFSDKKVLFFFKITLTGRGFSFRKDTDFLRNWSSPKDLNNQCTKLHLTSEPNICHVKNWVAVSSNQLVKQFPKPYLSIWKLSKLGLIRKHDIVLKITRFCCHLICWILSHFRGVFLFIF